jgi:outer membrane protein assembly factor BamB
MRSGPWRHAVVVTSLITIGLAGTGMSLRAQLGVGGWPMAGGNGAHTGLAAGPTAPYRELWRVPLEGEAMAGPVVTGDAVVVLTTQEVIAVDAPTGRGRWAVARSEGPAGAPALVGDVVIHASGDRRSGTVAARDVEDGSLRWRSHLGEGLQAPFVAGHDLLVAGTVEGTLVGLDPATGTERFRFAADGAIRSAPVVTGQAVVAAWEQAGTARATVRAFRVDDGGDEAPLWQTTTDPGPFPSAAVAAGTEAVFVAGGDGSVRAIGLEDGTERWRARLGEVATRVQLPAAGPPLVVADRLQIARLEPATGRQLWSFRLADARTLPTGDANSLAASAPVVAGSDVVIGDAAGVVSAVDARSGHRVWRANVADGPIAPPAADGARLYLTTFGDDGELIALEHDPEGRRLAEVSETVLRPGRALLNFVVAFLAVSAVILGVFRYLLRGRRRLRDTA